MNTATRSANGYAAWRLIAEELRADISEGRLAVGARLPGEHDLALRFGVNRHTVRQGIAALAAEGVVESRRGSGTFVTGRTVHVHRLGLRTRLSSSLAAGATSAGRMLDHQLEIAPDEVREQLGLLGPRALRVETLRTVSGSPIARGTHWLDPDRVPGFVTHLRRTGSITAAFRAGGIDDYLRKSTVVTARQGTVAETTELALEPGAVVLVTTALDVTPDGAPLQHVVARFAASRVTLDIEHPGVAAG